jgi:hypothetical protein
MRFIDGVLGNASAISVSEVESETKPLLIADERIEMAFRLARDLIVFTNRRLILVDKQGLTGKKVEYASIPYRSIVRYSVETAGHLDLDAELRIYLAGSPVPIERKFQKSGANILDVQRALSHAVLNKS